MIGNPEASTNARGQRIRVTRYPCTAQVQAHRDENDLVNGLAGTTRTYDLLDRPLTVTDVVGGQTSFSYPNATTVNQFKTITSTLTDTGTAVHDGLLEPTPPFSRLPTIVRQLLLRSS